MATSQTIPRRYCFGPYELDMERRELRKFGTRVRLQPQPLEALLCLLNRPGEVVAREELSAKLWPSDVHVDFEHSVNRIMNKLRLALCDAADSSKYIETLPGRGYRFLVVPADCSEPACGGANESTLRPTRGALPLNCPYYVERAVDGEVHRAIASRDSIVLLKGARQTGKTSLLSRLVDNARRSGAQTVVTDFQRFGGSEFASIESLLSAIAADVADQAGFEIDFEQDWLPRRGASANFDRWFKTRVLTDSRRHVVWALDEADRLFAYRYASEFFGLLRCWHNERALRSGTPCERLTLVIAYATEVQLFIADLNQSPFNVGTRLFLGDFAEDEVRELNRRYDYPIAGGELAAFYKLLGGHPYLTQDGLHDIATHRRTYKELARVAASEEGPFGEHLRRLLLAVRNEPGLFAAVSGLLQGKREMPADSFYRLRTAGVIRGDCATNAELRCGVYRDYLSRYLL